MTEHAKTAAAWIANLDRMIAQKIDRCDMHADNAMDRDERHIRTRARDYEWHEQDAMRGQHYAMMQVAIVRLMRMGLIK